MPIAHRKGFPWALASIMVVIASLVIVLALNTGGMRNRLLGKNLLSHIHSLAVMPLQNLSGDPAQEYFIDGMTAICSAAWGCRSKLRHPDLLKIWARDLQQIELQFFSVD